MAAHRKHAMAVPPTPPESSVSDGKAGDRAQITAVIVEATSNRGDRNEGALMRGRRGK